MNHAYNSGLSQPQPHPNSPVCVGLFCQDRQDNVAVNLIVPSLDNLVMYRERIREAYPNLSRSYRRVADFILAHYDSVAFMTAAQLADAVDVDTTTVVRFAQRLAYAGYPDLLLAIRQTVRAEIYAARHLPPADIPTPVARFYAYLEGERQNLARTVLQNSAQQIAQAVDLLAQAQRFFLLGDSYATGMACTVAQQLRRWDRQATVVEGAALGQAAALAHLRPGDLLIGLGASLDGAELARAMAFARSQGCRVLAVVGDLRSPVNRAADLVIFAPTFGADTAGEEGIAGVKDGDEGERRLPSVAPLLATLSALIQVACAPDDDLAAAHSAQIDLAYRFLTEAENFPEGTGSARAES